MANMLQVVCDVLVLEPGSSLSQASRQWRCACTILALLGCKLDGTQASCIVHNSARRLSKVAGQMLLTSVLLAAHLPSVQCFV
jgi:hypothetical protein